MCLQDLETSMLLREWPGGLRRCLPCPLRMILSTRESLPRSLRSASLMTSIPPANAMLSMLDSRSAYPCSQLGIFPLTRAIGELLPPCSEQFPHTPSLGKERPILPLEQSRAADIATVPEPDHRTALLQGSSNSQALESWPLRHRPGQSSRPTVANVPTTYFPFMTLDRRPSWLATNGSLCCRRRTTLAR
jgi:hypothetical protein